MATENINKKNISFDNTKKTTKKEKEFLYEDYDSYEGQYISQFNADESGYEDIINIYKNDGKIKQAIDLPVLTARDAMRDYTHPRKEVYDFVQKYVLSKLPIPDILLNILSSRWAGVSVSYVSTGIEDGFMVIDNIHTISPLTYVPSSGIYDNKVIFTTSNYGEISVNRKSLIIHSHDAEFSNPYGKSMLIAVKDFYDKKAQCLDAWITFLSIYSTPFIYGTTSSDLPEEAQAAFRDALQNLRSGGVVVVTRDKDDRDNPSCEIEIKEAQKNTLDFQDFIKKSDRDITTSLGISSLLFESDESGSYSLGAIHERLYQKQIRRIQLQIRDIFLNKIIAPLILANFNERNTGELTFDGVTPREFKELSSGIQYLVKSGFLDPKNKADQTMTRGLLGLPNTSGSFNIKIDEPHKDQSGGN